MSEPKGQEAARRRVESTVPRMRDICGAGNVITDPLELRTYECDGLTAHRSVPALVVLPASAAEVAAVVTECAAAGVPFVRGGMGVQSAYYSVDPGRGPCHECERGTMLAELDQPTKAGARWRLIMRLRQVNPGIGPVAGAIGAAMAMETIRYLTGFAEPVAAGVLHSFDLGDGGAETLTPWPRRPDCPVCQPAGSAR